MLTHTAFFVDTRIPEGEPDREYELDHAELRGYKITTPQYYDELNRFFLDVLSENEKLRRRLRSCEE